MAQPTPPKYPDAYANLGLPPTASSADIKSAYRKLALLHHPDKNLTESDGAAAEFRKVNEAFEILRDDRTKANYDRQYSEVLKDWRRYDADVAEFARDPETWRKKQASAEQQRTNTRKYAGGRFNANFYPYEDYEDDDDETSAYDFFFRFGFGGSGFGFRYAGGGPPPERPGDQERKAREKKESDVRFSEYMKAEREKMLKAANQRALELQRQETKAAQPRGDGIRTYSLEEKLAMAKAWVQGIQAKYAKELSGIKETKIHEGVQLDLGWEKIKKGRHTCNFCDAVMPGYSYRCPSGGAVACRPCKNAIDSSTLKKPFDFANTHAGSKKGKAQKETSDQVQKANAEPKPKDVAPEEPEEDVDFNKNAAKLAAELAAHEKKSRRREKARIAKEESKARQEAAREERESAARLAAEVDAQEKHKMEKAARQKARADEVARETARLKKEAEVKEAQQAKAAKKAARKKAAREKKQQAAGGAEQKSKEEQAMKDKEVKPQHESEETATHQAQEDEAADQEPGTQPVHDAQEAASHQPYTPIRPKVNTTGTKLYCVACKGEGHVARKCPSKPSETVKGTMSRGPSDRVSATEDTATSTKPQPNGAASKAPQASRVCYTCKKEGHVKRDCPGEAEKRKGQAL